jgi:hypothetical protein
MRAVTEGEKSSSGKGLVGCARWIGRHAVRKRTLTEQDQARLVDRGARAGFDTAKLVS